MSFNLGGWIAVSRKLFTGPEWAGEPYSHREAWIELIALARFEAGEAVVGGRRVLLQRGQLAWSVAQLAKRWKWSPGKVNRFLSELQAAKRIDRLPSHVTSVMTIVNYDRYQFGGATDGLTASAGQPTDQPAGQPTEQSTGQRVDQLANAESAFNSGPKPTADGRDGLTDELTDGGTNGDPNGATDGLRNKKVTNKQPSPPTPQGALGGEGELFEAIKKRGVNQVRVVASHLDAVGCSFSDVAPVFDYFDQNRDRFESPEGALYARLLAFEPGQSAGAGWVQFDPAKERERRRRDDAAKAVSDAEAKRANKEALDAERRRIGAEMPRFKGLTQSQRRHLEEIVEPNAWSRRRAPDSLEKLCCKYLADHPEWEPPQLAAIGADGAEGFEPL